MSTLKVNTLQDSSGNNPSTALQIAEGRAKIWVSFNGTGTIAVKDGFNVSSLTDNGTGAYTVNFTNAMSNTNYCCIVGAGNNALGSKGAWNSVYDDTTTLTSSVRLALYTSSGGADDNEQVFMVIYGAN